MKDSGEVEGCWSQSPRLLDRGGETPDPVIPSSGHVRPKGVETPRIGRGPMKIIRVAAIPVCVPLKKGLMTKTAHGEHVVSPCVVVRVHTDEGLVGLGEATVAPRW